MKSLWDPVSWRTLLAGFLCGYLTAWGVHRATHVWSWSHGWVEEPVPFLVPAWSRPTP